ncbi:MAG: hypothetical protein ACE5GF_09125, partial [Thermodesulfobacteriota bacterium]
HPLPNSLALRASVINNFQLYDNSHSTYGKKRRDHIVKIAPGLIYRYGDFILKLQYSHSRSESNITAYDYARNIYGAGIEYSY